MGFWAAAIPAAASLIGSGLSAAGGKKASKQAAQHLTAQKQARREAMGMLSPSQFFMSSQHLFPGLIGAPSQVENSTGGTKRDKAQMEGYSLAEKVGQHVLTGGAGNVPGRAQGGPVQAGKPYMVGEQGPEIVKPKQDATVIPNPATQTQQQQPATNQQAQPTTQQPAQQTQQPQQQPEQQPTTQPTTQPAQQDPTQQAAPAPAPGDPAQAQATVITPPTTNELMMSHLFNFLMNPGQTSTIGYERQQEQIESGGQQQVQQITGGAAGSGFDPSSGGVQSMIQNVMLNKGKLRSEAARDQSLVEEQLRRQDIGTGAELFMNMMQYILGLQSQRAQAASGTGFTPITPVNSGAQMGAGIAQAGNIMGQYMQDRDQNTTDPDA